MDLETIDYNGTQMPIAISLAYFNQSGTLCSHLI
jgi:hypothetical protein